MFRKFGIFILSIVFLCIAISGCLPEGEDEFIVAFVPSVEVQTIIDHLDAFETELEKHVGMKVKAVVMPDYSACVAAMGTGKADAAFLPPLAYVLGNEEYGFDVLLKAERHGKTVYRGEIIVRVDSGIETIEDLKGKKFAFVSPSSASGGLYPKILLMQHGIDPEKDLAQVIYPGQHPMVVVAVMNGQVDAGAVFEGAREISEDVAPGVMAETKVLAFTMDIPADTVSVRKDLADDLRAKLVDALKGMANGKEGLLYEIYQIEYLHDATDDDYDPLREVANSLGLDIKKYYAE